MRYFFSLILALFILNTVAFTPDSLVAQEHISLSWALLQDTDNGQESLDITTPLSLRPSASLQFYFSLQPGTFLYLILLDSAGNIALFFPETPNFYSTHPPNQKQFRIPADPDRFRTVPPPGQEKIYLIVSSSQLTKLEKTSAEYLTNSKDPQKKAALLQEMKKLRRTYSSMSQSPEVSVPVAGTIKTRGTQSHNNSFNVIQVSGVPFYSRIMRINHE